MKRTTVQPAATSAASRASCARRTSAGSPNARRSTSPPRRTRSPDGRRARPGRRRTSRATSRPVPVAGVRADRRARPRAARASRPATPTSSPRARARRAARCRACRATPRRSTPPRPDPHPGATRSRPRRGCARAAATVHSRRGCASRLVTGTPSRTARSRTGRSVQCRRTATSRSRVTFGWPSWVRCANGGAATSSTPEQSCGVVAHPERCPEPADQPTHLAEQPLLALRRRGVRRGR